MVVLTERFMAAEVLGYLVDVVVLFDLVSGPLQSQDGLLVSQRADPVPHAVIDECVAVDVDVVSTAEISHRFAIGAVDGDVVVGHVA
jgi:hypothetical protein